MDLTPDTLFVLFLRVSGGAGIVFMAVFLWRLFQPLGSPKLMQVSNRVVLFAAVFCILRLLSSVLDVVIVWADGYLLTALVNNTTIWYLVWYLRRQRRDFIVKTRIGENATIIGTKLDSVIETLQQSKSA